jgi:hypothetical protein
MRCGPVVAPDRTIPNELVEVEFQTILKANSLAWSGIERSSGNVLKAGVSALSRPLPRRWLTLPRSLLTPLDLVLNRFAHECHSVLAVGENGCDPFEGASGKLYGRAFRPALLSSHA